MKTLNLKRSSPCPIKVLQVKGRSNTDRRSHFHAACCLARSRDRACRNSASGQGDDAQIDLRWLTLRDILSMLQAAAELNVLGEDKLHAASRCLSVEPNVPHLQEKSYLNDGWFGCTLFWRQYHSCYLLNTTKERRAQWHDGRFGGQRAW